ncbi:MAG: hypothetical protein WAV05_14755 [Anaerolineales bacterium]
MNDTSNSNIQKISLLAEWLLVIFSVIVCMGVAAVIGSQQSPLWPVPGLYLIEFILISIIGVGNQLVKTSNVAFSKAFPWLSSKAITWIIVGILLPFVIFGGFSIGLFLLPALLAFLLAGIISDWRSTTKIISHIGIAVMSAVIQGSLILIFNIISFPRLY